jgi:hypothetical protein
MNKYYILILLIVFGCSSTETNQKNNEAKSDSIVIPIYSCDTVLVEICDQVIFDQSTCKYGKYKNPFFILAIYENNDTLDVYVELISKGGINKTKNTGCFIHNNNLFIIDTLCNHADIFKPTDYSTVLFFEKKKESNYFLIDDRGSFWHYKIFEDNVNLEFKSLCKN